MKRAWLCVAFAAACGDDIPSDPTGTTSTGTADGTTMPSASTTSIDATTGSVDDTSTGEPPPSEIVLDAWLDLETLESIHVVVTTTGDAALATITPTRGYGLASDGAELSGPARIDAYPEVDATFYTARISARAEPDGPCGDEPVSLALSLHHDGDGSFVAGGLTGYCGAETWFGVPPIEPLRISGRLR